MKQRIFTLLMLLALIFVAGSAMAQTKLAPFQGSNYNYTLGGIDVVTGGTAAASYEVPDDVIITDVSGATVLASGVQSYTFNVAYNDDATPGPHLLTVTVTEGSCTNFINVTVTVRLKPTLALSLGVSTFDCQALGTPAGSNQDAATADGTNGSTAPKVNEIIFTVTPTIENIGTATYNYDYNIDIPQDADNDLAGYSVTFNGGASGASYDPLSGDVTGATTAAPHTFTIKFTTTVNIANVDIDGLIAYIDGSPNNPDLVVTTTDGGTGNYEGETITQSTAGEVVPTTPAIGGTIQ